MLATMVVASGGGSMRSIVLSMGIWMGNYLPRHHRLSMIMRIE
jgi:hypothetical protein